MLVNKHEKRIVTSQNVTTENKLELNKMSQETNLSCCEERHVGFTRTEFALCARNCIKYS